VQVSFLESAPSLPAIKLSNPIAECAQEAADAIAAGGAPPDLGARLQSRGTPSGSIIELHSFGYSKPVAIVAGVLLCDGDANRQNRQFLLSDAVTIGGLGLGESADHGSLAVMTLCGLFAIALKEKRDVECEGVPSKDFTEVRTPQHAHRNTHTATRTPQHAHRNTHTAKYAPRTAHAHSTPWRTRNSAARCDPSRVLAYDVAGARRHPVGAAAHDGA
jgi:hypothetical protein